MVRISLAVSSCSLLLVASCTSGTATDDPAAPPFGMVVTQGIGSERAECPPAVECGGGSSVRETLCGEITASDGSVWVLPAPVSGGAVATAVYDECSVGGHNDDFESQLTTKVVDPEGTEITAYLFGDNYFELYVNGAFIGRDGVGFTPFDSYAARFQVEYPVTYAALLVDWEGYLGIGLEDMRGELHIGDGGFIAAFSDGTVTNGDWKCRVFYVAPLDDASCVAIDENGNPDSSGCPSADESVSCIASEPTSTCRAAHFALPSDWMSPEYDDSGWLPAATFTADEVTGSKGFRDYEDTLFRGAEFIWTNNLDLDNLVLCRGIVDSPG